MRRTGKMRITYQSVIEKYKSDQKFWSNKIFYEKTTRNGKQFEAEVVPSSLLVEVEV